MIIAHDLGTTGNKASLHTVEGVLVAATTVGYSTHYGAAGVVEQDPADVFEWVDVIILAFDGAWRAGWEPQQIIDAIKAKQARNEKRTWPDWRTAAADKAIEHIAEGGAA